MPVSPTYPGVYLEELPSTTHSVVAAATSNAAVIDWFPRGPINQAVPVTGLSQFSAIFGPVLSNGSSLYFGSIEEGSEGSYAVQQFFLNGGSLIWVVRVVPESAVAAVMWLDVASTPASYLTISAANPGVWGNFLAVGLTPQVAPPNTKAASKYQLYTLQIGLAFDPVALPSPPAVLPPSLLPTVLETYYGVSLNPAEASFLPNVVNGVSQYIVAATATALPAQVTAVSPPAPPTVGTTPVATWNALTNGYNSAWFDSATDFVEALIAQLQTGTGATIIPSLSQIAPQVFNILLLPAAAILPQEGASLVITQAIQYCAANQAFFLIDPPPPSTILQNPVQTPYPWFTSTPPGYVTPGPGDSQITAWAANFTSSQNYSAATYYPWLFVPDPANNFQPRLVGPSGTVAGIYAQNDFNQGVWTAPAGTGAVIQGATLSTALNDVDSGILNPLGINALRSFPVYGNIVWGARTLAGADLLQSQFKYVNVRRLTDFIEQSLVQSLKWAVFQPNAAPLWSSITLEATSFLAGLFAGGAFQGATAAQAYFVQCDGTTTSPQDILNGVVNVIVGFAPVYPAEFIVLQIELMLGQSQAS
ncbi:MAG TPA: phage tail sheath C-terminal domain-containing protein [Thermoanaerobaculia bacterium]|nr:phage tail sheath C-terminal domain-containing protein [Thermoanaerobaculia bacterium]